MSALGRFGWLVLALAALGTASCDSGSGSGSEEYDAVTGATGAADVVVDDDAADAVDAVDAVDAPGATDVVAPDGAGEAPDVTAGVRGCIQGEFAPYYGVIHAHSTLSDGAGPPEQAFAHARDVAELDILILTDHMEAMLTGDDKQALCRATAETFYEPGVYLTDCGFEYATSLLGATGHNNVFFSNHFFPLDLAFESFYRDLNACEGCIAQFNHPGSEEHQHWQDFALDVEADTKLTLMEFNTSADPWAFFFRALDVGWHVSPTDNQDNHDADWGSKNDRRSGFWLAELTHAGLYDAMVERRSFRTGDRNASIRMTAELPDVGTCWMGSIIEGAMGDLTVEVELGDEDGTDGFTTVQLYGPGQELLGEHDCAGANPCTATWTLPADPDTYFVARAHQSDEDYLVSAPIWLE